MKLICNKIKIYGKFYKLLTKFKTLVETDLCPSLHSVAKICQQIISEEILGKKGSSKLLEKRKGKKCFKMFFQSSRPIIFTVLDKISNLELLYSDETRNEKSLEIALIKEFLKGLSTIHFRTNEGGLKGKTDQKYKQKQKEKEKKR